MRGGHGAPGADRASAHASVAADPTAPEATGGGGGEDLPWHYAIGRKRHGPVTRQELLMLVARGELRRDALVWREGMAAWTPAKLVSELDLEPSRGASTASRGRGWLIAIGSLILILGLAALALWQFRPDLLARLGRLPLALRSAAIESRADKRTTEAVALIACGYTIIQPNGLRTDEVMSLGTSFLVTTDGYLLTNRHVVEQVDQLGRAKLVLDKLRTEKQIDVTPRIWVYLGSKSARYEAEIRKIFLEDDVDLAVLKIDVEGRPFFRIADAQPGRGEEASAMGFPGQASKPISKEEVREWIADSQKWLESFQGKGDYIIDMAFKPSDFDYSLTKGIVSRVSRRGGIELLQHTAEIKPGNSGGPLVLEDGRVVGVNTFYVGGKDEGEGRTFYAISLPSLHASLAEVIPGWGE
jgi:S1-C subfamily serine protease